MVLDLTFIICRTLYSYSWTNLHTSATPSHMHCDTNISPRLSQRHPCVRIKFLKIIVNSVSCTRVLRPFVARNVQVGSGDPSVDSTQHDDDVAPSNQRMRACAGMVSCLQGARWTTALIVRYSSKKIVRRFCLYFHTIDDKLTSS